MFTIVTCIWNRDPKLLARALATWRNQTLPPRIVVVDANPSRLHANRVRKLCRGLVYIRVPRPQFNLSYFFNVGIKRSPPTQYTLCTGAEIMFSPAYIETLANIMQSGYYALAPCATLIKHVQVPNDPHSEWGRILASCNPNSHIQVSPGTIFCAPRSWWFGVQGYDERQHFAWTEAR